MPAVVPTFDHAVIVTLEPADTETARGPQNEGKDEHRQPRYATKGTGQAVPRPGSLRRKWNRDC